MHGSKISWKKTLHLPKSAFPARALVKDRPKYIQRCTDDLYTWQRSRQILKTFTLHDGPPYANGELHIGHALNKILKDIICRSRLADHRVDWRPGWDCHGLPIELKALQQQGERASSNAVDVRAAARRLAAKTVHDQKQTFRKWGIMADWESAWTTMDRDFEIKQMGVFKAMASKGLIYRRFKPVFWSPASRTALAEAELEYHDDHISTAAFVKYPLVMASKSFSTNLEFPLSTVSAVIWTTTPWTLPANRAIGFNREIDYTIAESSEHGRLLIASSRLSELEHHLNENLRISTSMDGEDLSSMSYEDEIFGSKRDPRPFLHADFVSETSGSGLVHLAPGHGTEDYELCSKYDGITAFAPVDDNGDFTAGAFPRNPETLLGLDILGAGQEVVLSLLNDRRLLLAQHQYTHNYPYDWRSKQPVIIRATEQWFADVGNIREDALGALDTVTFYPPSSKTRLEAFIKNRSEWCISRQRAWGVPIPVLYKSKTKEVLCSADSIDHIISVVKQRGIDAWWTDEDTDPSWTPPSLRNSDGGSQYSRGKDTMDVWFDSGTSWTQTNNGKDMDRHVADCYIEGSDQHRGWFQSSLLTCVANQAKLPQDAKEDQIQAKAPFTDLITHGFTLDQDGRKMSKSVGNVVSPDEIMEGTLLPTVKRKLNGKLIDVQESMGPDALRLWAASCDYTSDVKISQRVLQAIHGNISKYRVTFKLILGILDDFDPALYVSPQNLGMIHQIVLWRLDAVNSSVQDHYQSFEFSRAVNEITKFIVNDLSSSYFEWIKDAAYCGSAGERLEVQSTLFQIHRHLQQMLAPIMPLLIEETWEYTPEQIKEYERVSPGYREFSQPDRDPEADNQLPFDYVQLMEAHVAVKAIQERARNEKRMGDSLESYVCFETESSKARTLLSRYPIDQLQVLFGVSGLQVVNDIVHLPELGEAAWVFSERVRILGKEVIVHVYEPQLAKCVRCWRYVAPLRGSEVSICGRCKELVGQQSWDNA